MKKALVVGLISLALPVAVFAAPSLAPLKCSLTADKTSIKSGQPVMLNWTSNGTRAQLGFSGVPTSGSKVVKPVVGPWSYSLFVFRGSDFKECSVTIKVK